jgi:hypothetical protein
MHQTKFDSNTLMEIFIIPVDSHYSNYDAIAENIKLYNINAEKDRELSNNSRTTNCSSIGSESDHEGGLKLTDFLKHDWSYRINCKKLIIYKTLISKIPKKSAKS